MFDAKLRPVIDPVLIRTAAICVRAGISANMLTLAGFFAGLICGVLIFAELYLWAALALIISRILDGLDGAVARLSEPTDFGGFLDIVCDFLFYALVPFCFALSRPDLAPAAAFLMFSFVGTGTSFLAYAVLEAKHKSQTSRTSDTPRAQTKNKSFAYLGGLTEGAETIVFFLLLLLFSDYFVLLAVGFAGLCWITTFYRIYATWAEFGKES